MLDEIQEYREYTCNLDGTEKVRFLSSVFQKKNQLNGLSRALVIIARKELTDRGYFDQTGADREIIDAVIQALKEWLGFADENESTLTDYNAWLQRYYESRIMPLGASVKPWAEILKKKRQYGQRMYSDKKMKKTLPYALPMTVLWQMPYFLDHCEGII